MIVLDLFLIFLAVTFLFFIVGVFRKNYIVLIVSGIFFLSIAVLLQLGVEYVSGTSALNTYNGTAIISVATSDVYTTWSDPYLQTSFVALFMLFGLYLITVSWLKLFYKRALGVDIFIGDEDEHEED